MKAIKPYLIPAPNTVLRLPIHTNLEDITSTMRSGRDLTIPPFSPYLIGQGRILAGGLVFATFQHTWPKKLALLVGKQCRSRERLEDMYVRHGKV